MVVEGRARFIVHDLHELQHTTVAGLVRKDDFDRPLAIVPLIKVLDTIQKLVTIRRLVHETRGIDEGVISLPTERQAIVARVVDGLSVLDDDRRSRRPALDDLRCPRIACTAGGRFQVRGGSSLRHVETDVSVHYSRSRQDRESEAENGEISRHHAHRTGTRFAQVALIRPGGGFRTQEFQVDGKVAPRTLLSRTHLGPASELVYLMMYKQRPPEQGTSSQQSLDWEHVCP